MADAYLPVWLHDIPAYMVFQPGGCLRENVRHAVDQNVVRVFAGPTACHIRIDIQRPYFRAISSPSIQGHAND